MGRRMAPAIVAAILTINAGCRNRPTQLDPFLGRTTVPAPPTGSVGGQAPGTYTYPAAPPTMTAPPTTMTPPTASPPSGSLYSPPGGFTPNNSAPPRTLSTTNDGRTLTSPPAQFTSSGGSNNGTPIRIVEPPPRSPTTSATTTARPTVGAPTDGVDIMSLPVRNGAAQPKTAGSGGGVAQNYQQPSSYPPGVTAAPAQSFTLPPQQAVYGFNEAYTQLAGRLEYSPADGRWFLRYVTPGNMPDRYGGVAWLAVQSAAPGLHHGDFVRAEGRLDTTNAGGGMPPVFTAMAVRRQ